MTTENALIVDATMKFPSFCALTYQEGDPSILSWIDFWAVEPDGAAEADYRRGQRFGDEAIQHVRLTAQPVFIECVLVFIGIKLRDGNRDASELERGFIDQIEREFPHAISKVLLRLSQRRKENEGADRALAHNFIRIQNNRSPTHQLH